MGRPELASDERYATHRARGTRQEELDALIGEWTKTMTIDELEAKMIEAGVPAGRVYDAEDMLADPHFAAREALVTVEDAEFGAIRMQGVFRSEEHTSELQSLMRISYAVFCLTKKTKPRNTTYINHSYH